MDQLLAKLAEQQAVLRRQQQALSDNNSPAKDRDYSSDSSVLFTPATDDYDMGPPTVQKAKPAAPVTPSAEPMEVQLRRLKEELQRANCRISRMDQELVQTRITKHTLDQALGPASDADFAVKGDAGEQSISSLQSAFNASTRPVFQAREHRNSFESVHTDASDFSRPQAIWTTPARQTYNPAPPQYVDHQFADPGRHWGNAAARPSYDRAVGQPPPTQYQQHLQSYQHAPMPQYQQPAQHYQQPVSHHQYQQPQVVHYQQPARLYHQQPAAPQYQPPVRQQPVQAVSTVDESAVTRVAGDFSLCPGGPVGRQARDQAPRLGVPHQFRNNTWGTFHNGQPTFSSANSYLAAPVYHDPLPPAHNPHHQARPSATPLSPTAPEFAAPVIVAPVPWNPSVRLREKYERLFAYTGGAGLSGSDVLVTHRAAQLPPSARSHRQLQLEVHSRQDRVQQRPAGLHLPAAEAQDRHGRAEV